MLERKNGANFSVLMSLYNGENAEYFECCLESLYSQILMANEIVLVIDGAIDSRLLTVIERWEDKLNIVKYPLDKNVGLSQALNYGLSRCQFELVFRMDTDDICNPKRFYRQFEFMNSNPDVDILGSFCENISESGQVLNVRRMPTEHSVILKNIWACPFIHPSVVFRKNKIMNIGSYNPATPNRQDDYELWIRAAFSGLVFANIPEPLVKYRIPDNAYSKSTVRIGFNRAKIGFKAVCAFDPRFISFLGLMYPLIRAMLPRFVQIRFANFFSKFDPRSIK